MLTELCREIWSRKASSREKRPCRRLRTAPTMFDTDSSLSRVTVNIHQQIRPADRTSISTHVREPQKWTNDLCSAILLADFKVWENYCQSFCLWIFLLLVLNIAEIAKSNCDILSICHYSFSETRSLFL